MPPSDVGGKCVSIIIFNCININNFLSDGWRFQQSCKLNCTFFLSVVMFINNNKIKKRFNKKKKKKKKLNINKVSMNHDDKTSYVLLQ